MNESIDLTKQFEANRAHLRAVAFRMLGSQAEAEDAVQEAWLRLHRAGAEEVDNLGGWLTTVVARVCLDMLRVRKARREDAYSAPIADAHRGEAANDASEHDTFLADSISAALLVVLETLAPAERVAFVLHDMFDLPFDDIAPIVGRSSMAARQLASRARRRVQGASATSESDPARHRAIVDAFLAASRGGDLAALIAMLDPNVVLRADATAVQYGAEKETRGAADVAARFAGRAKAAQPALVDGKPALVWAPGGQPRVVFGFTIERGAIVAIELIADAESIASRQLTLLRD